MSNDELKNKIDPFKSKILKLERESLNNITKTDDEAMALKIIHLFEDVKNDN